MDINRTSHFPVMLVIDRFSSKQLAQVGKQLRSLRTLPPITLVKQVPFFPAQFYGIPDSSRLERQVVQEAKHILLKALDIIGVRARYHVVRGSNPSQLSLSAGIVIKTMTELKAWLMSLEEPITSTSSPMMAVAASC